MVKPYLTVAKFLILMKNCLRQTLLVSLGSFLFAGVLFIANWISAEEKAEAKQLRTGIIFETQSIDPEVFTRVEGAKKMVLVAVQEWEYGVKLFTAKEWRSQAYDNVVFRRNAELVADAVMEKVKPEFIRDARGVITYAVIRGEDPFLSSILLSDKFLPKFKKNLGDSLRVIILDRQLIYVFPEAGGKLDEFGAALAEQYQQTKQPVSLEIIRMNDKGFKVIGSIGGD